MAIDLIAYKVTSDEGWTIAPGPVTRDWMDATPERFAYRCLPLAMANQGGWIISCPTTFSATWNGGVGQRDIKLQFQDPECFATKQILTHFGSGILTFSLPWLFRTSPGYGLWVRGPTNTIKDNAIALDGFVETDWAPYTFTMNWRIMRRNSPVWFKKGDPICMILPYAIETLEQVTPIIRNITDDAELHQQYIEFHQKRRELIQNNIKTGSMDWEKNYMKGLDTTGKKTHSHRTKLELKAFPPSLPTATNY
jgi:hypothetical protein